MRLSRFSTNETLYSSQHQLVLRKSERGFNARAGFSDYAISTGISFDRQDSASKAVQTLVELHVLELLGKAANVAYWECLSAGATNPGQSNAAARDWKRLSPAARQAQMKAALTSLGYTGEFASALQRYQLDNGLNATGRPSFDTFLSLRNSDPTSATGVNADPSAAPISKTKRISMRANNLGPTWRAEIGLTRSSFVSCYYRADDGVIAQIYPNPFNPRRWLAANTTHFVPDTVTEDQLYITGRSPQFLCLASDKDPQTSLPNSLRKAPLQDLRPFGVTSFRAIVDAYASATGGVTDFAIWK